MICAHVDQALRKEVFTVQRRCYAGQPLAVRPVATGAVVRVDFGAFFDAAPGPVCCLRRHPALFDDAQEEQHCNGEQHGRNTQANLDNWRTDIEKTIPWSFHG
jgi:hypothetical protein